MPVRAGRASVVCAALSMSISIWMGWATPAWALSVTVSGSNPAQSFIPFGNLTGELSSAIFAAANANQPLPVPRFQQVYDASSFLGFGPDALLISSISFSVSDTQIGSNPGLLGGRDSVSGESCSDGRAECGLFTLTLAKTSKSVDGLALPADPYDPLDTTYDSNMTGMSAVFATSILLSDILDGDGNLTFVGPFFQYDPLVDGNLLIDIQITDFSNTADLTQGKTTLNFDATDDPSPPAPLPAPYSTADNFDGHDNLGFGLVTSFSLSTVPEPGTAVLLGLGLAGLAYRRQVQLAPTR